MAKGFKHGSGGGASLNFNVKSYDSEEVLLEAEAKENTIGIVTNTPITSWVFSAAEPAEPVEGLVWISTGASSPVEFNALKKNGIQVYPMSAKQYVSSAWVSKTAKSYQNGSWKDFTAYLYNAGDEFTDITGGWVTESYGSTPSKTIEGGVMQFVTYGGPWNYSILKTQNPINLTSYKTLYFRIPYDLHCGGAEHKVGVFESGRNLLVSTQITKDTAGTYSADISGVTGSFCVGASIMTRENSATDKMYIDLVWME